ncbi:hypothetical protein BJ912DRAFT_1096784 [Pholiota molesta]|nr:hypothetical protein BJ912DRAFT_1096784 [Pholiota molesta]
MVDLTSVPPPLAATPLGASLLPPPSPPAICSPRPDLAVCPSPPTRDVGRLWLLIPRVYAAAPPPSSRLPRMWAGSLPQQRGYANEHDDATEPRMSRDGAGHDEQTWASTDNLADDERALRSFVRPRSRPPRHYHNGGHHDASATSPNLSACPSPPTRDVGWFCYMTTPRGALLLPCRATDGEHDGWRARRLAASEHDQTDNRRARQTASEHGGRLASTTDGQSTRRTAIEHCGRAASTNCGQLARRTASEHETRHRGRRMGPYVEQRRAGVGPGSEQEGARVERVRKRGQRHDDELASQDDSQQRRGRARTMASNANSQRRRRSATTTASQRRRTTASKYDKRPASRRTPRQRARRTASKDDDGQRAERAASQRGRTTASEDDEQRPTAPTTDRMARAMDGGGNGQRGRQPRTGGSKDEHLLVLSLLLSLFSLVFSIFNVVVY